ncbi:MAG: hypothetical protein GF334_06720, partial [Candidatus Altiarchaeales archaeon]|nr:hypothetical protein [Candidatus Altiarchaeales archaeon]
MVDRVVDAGDFEQAIKLFLSRMGFKVTDTVSMPDGSTDFLAKTSHPMGGEVYSLIRASPLSRQINVGDVKDLYSLMDSRKAVRSAYISLSDFDKQAREYAKDKPLSLINKYQLVSSMEKRGLTDDQQLMERLNRFGLAERHYGDAEYSFVFSMTRQQVDSYFKKKESKSFLGKPKDKLVRVMNRYAPVGAFRVSSTKEVRTGEHYLRSIEVRNYVFVNLNNLDLFYVASKRRGGGVERQLKRSPILRTIIQLPDASRQHLIDLLDHGDLPVEALGEKDLSILTNRGVVSVYTGSKEGKTFLKFVQRLTEDVRDILLMVVTEILSSSAEPAASEDEVEVEKKATAELNLPHAFGGEYNLFDHLQVREGVNPDVEVDDVEYPSRDISLFLGKVFQASVQSKGIVFLPYYRARYVKPKSGEFSKYEVHV